MSEVWVIAEQRLGKLMNVSLELLGKGAELAQKLKVGLAAVLLGDNVHALAEELICYGADMVYLEEDPRLRLYQSEIYADLVAKLVSTYQPQIVLIGATGIGRDLAPRIAAKLKTGLTAHCVELSIIDEDSERPQLTQVVPGWEGNLMVNIACPVRRPQMATVSPGVVTKRRREEPVEELAMVLGGAVAGTRPAVDSGWIPEHRMIGQSGKTVRPKLFISIGASGAPQFTTGFLKAKVVLAIDQNPKAPIFEVADIGLVGDLREILPCLMAELKEAGLCV
jgi:electron transfer flavoprotein alpha subunit